MHKIKQFIIDQSLSSNYSFSNQEKEEENINNLAKLNIFIGQNNSGKSRFLRLIAEQDHGILPNDLDITKLNELIREFKETVSNHVKQTGASDFGGVHNKTTKINEINEIGIGTKALLPFIETLNELASLNDVTNLQGNASIDVVNQTAVPKIRAYCKKILPHANEIIGSNKDIEYSFKKLYIPVLRGLRPLVSSQVGDGFKITDNYHDRTKRDYFSNAKDLEIFTGLGLYEHTKKLLLGNLTDRRIISDYQDFLSATFFSGQDVALIPSHNMDVLTIKIGKEKERPIHHLGDGIQSIIIQTFPLFANTEENLLIFIEEPELYLHPGLQRKLIETFMDKRFRNYQYFITTHSNHFLDLTLDEDSISIYKFIKSLNSEDEAQEYDAKFKVENVNNEDMSILDLIGVRNSSIFLSNCTIWVEGITDRYYIRKFFEVYQNEYEVETIFKEDSHYSFVEYSGGNITHWSFLDDDEVEDRDDPDNIFRSMAVEKICNRLFLVTDKDGELKNERQAKLSKALKENYYCLEVREIENVLTPAVIKKVIIEYEKLDTIDELSFKNEIEQEAYKNEYLGLYIESNLNGRKRKSKYQAKSGTVSDKVTFCKKAVKYIRSKEDLSNEAIVLCEKIYEFIKRNNAV